MVARLLVTASIVLLMLYCLLSKKELFPFAPYTMYSARSSPQTELHLRVHLQQRDGEWIEVKDAMIRPLDEARFKQSILNNYFAADQNLKAESIHLKAKAALRIASDLAKSRFTAIRLQVENYKSLADLRAGQSQILQQVDYRDD